MSDVVDEQIKKTEAEVPQVSKHHVSIAGEVNRMVQAEVEDIYKRLENLRQQAKFPSFGTVNIPTVLVLGNHSSGKSTFINYMLQQDVQKAGRAPTDCTFTLLVGGKRAEKLDGWALSRHTKYGFTDIRQLFGEQFVSQIELKVLENSKLLNDSGLMIIDSPGMIDPPGASSDRTDMDRGYDFKRVVQWLAERADVILVMFDPDKPGTTFETLDVLTSSLREYSSKVQLILNKVDDFQTVHDFGRAYGALCWNLSKVIPRKDLPIIHTMYVPHNERVGNKEENVNSKKLIPSNVQQLLEHEFDGIRIEVVREIERAPDRATDNILNRLKTTASRLKMHLTVLEGCQKEYSNLKTFWTRVQWAGIAIGVGVAVMYIVRTAGDKTNETRYLRTGDNGVSASSASSASSTPNPVSLNASDAIHIQPLPNTAAKHSDAWKADWERQVQRSNSTFSYWKLIQIIGSSAIANLAIFKIGEGSLIYKRKNVLQWMPETFRRLYSNYLWKTDRAHDELLAEWEAVREGLNFSLTSVNIDEFPAFNQQDKTYLEEVLSVQIGRLDRSIRDHSGDDHAFLRFKHNHDISRNI